MWLDAAAAHEAGRVRVIEVRQRLRRRRRQLAPGPQRPRRPPGRRAWSRRDADHPHSWTTTHDTARLLVDVAADERAHGRAWPVPTAPPRTQREALGDIAASAGVRPPRVGVLGPRALLAVGLEAPGNVGWPERPAVHVSRSSSTTSPPSTWSAGSTALGRDDRPGGRRGSSRRDDEVR